MQNEQTSFKKGHTMRSEGVGGDREAPEIYTIILAFRLRLSAKVMLG